MQSSECADASDEDSCSSEGGIYTPTHPYNHEKSRDDEGHLQELSDDRLWVDNNELDDTIIVNIRPFQQHQAPRRISSPMSSDKRDQVKKQQQLQCRQTEPEEEKQHDGSRLSNRIDTKHLVKSIAGDDNVGNEILIFEGSHARNADACVLSKLQAPALAKSDKRSTLLRKMLRKESVKALQKVGALQDVYVHATQFGKAQRLVGLVNQHTERDENNIIGQLCAKAFFYTRKSRPARHGAFELPEETETNVDLDSFVEFVWMMFGVVPLADNGELQELCDDFKMRKHMNRRRKIAATGWMPEVLPAKPHRNRGLSVEPDFYRARYEEMLATLEADETLEITFNPATNISKQKDVSRRPASPILTENRTTNSRPKDRRSSMQREYDAHCNFAPILEARANPFASARAAHKGKKIGTSSPPQHSQLRRSPTKPVSFQKTPTDDASRTDWGTFYPQELTWSPYELPPIGTSVFYFDLHWPPNFKAGTFFVTEMQTTAPAISVAQIPLEPSLPPTSSESSSSPPLPPPLPSPPLSLFPTPLLPATQTATSSRRLPSKPPSTPKTKPLVRTDDEPAQTTGATGWDLVLMEMAQKRGGMGLMSALKKSDVNKRQPRSRLPGAGKSNKLWGEDDPEFTDVIDELKYRLEQMKQRDDDEDGGGGTQTKKKKKKNKKKEIEQDTQVIKNLFPMDADTRKADAAPLPARIFAAVPLPTPYSKEKMWPTAMPKPSMLPLPPPLPSAWPPAPQSRIMAPQHPQLLSLVDLKISQRAETPPPAQMTTTTNVVVSKTLPFGLYIPMDATLYCILPGQIHAAGALSLDLHDILASNLESAPESREESAGFDAHTEFCPEISTRHYIKKTSNDLPIPSNFYGAIQRLQKAHENRDKYRERERQRELRYYDALPPDGRTKALELTVPKEFSFESRRPSRQLLTFRKPQEVSCASLLPNSYYLPTKVLLNSESRDLSGAFFASTLRQPVDPLSILIIPPLANSSAHGAKTAKDSSNFHEPIERKTKSIIIEAREKKEADDKRQQEREKKKRNEYAAKSRGVHAAPQQSGKHIKLLEKYELVKPVTQPVIKGKTADLIRRHELNKQKMSYPPLPHNPPGGTAGYQFDLFADSVPLYLDDYY